MSDFKPIIFSGESMRKYWEGPSNKFSRYFTYIQGGFGLFNDVFKYIATAFTAYWTIRSADYWLALGISDLWLTLGMVIIFFIGVGVLGLLGRWQLYKLSKAKEFATTKEGTINGFNAYNINVLQVALIEAMAKNAGVDVQDLKNKLFSK